VFLALAMLAVGYSKAAELYVTPTGAGSMSGSDWADAIGNVQTAVNAAGIGDTIYLKQGTFTCVGVPSGGNISSGGIAISNKVLTISGGWAGTGSVPPGGGDFGTQPTVLIPSSTQMRILYATNSTVTIQGVTIQGGSWVHTGTGADHVYGVGMCLVSCVTTVKSCVVNNNNSAPNPGNNWGDQYAHDEGGAGIYASGGQLAIFNSTISSNYVNGTMKGLYKGGGLRCMNATLVATNTLFNGNWLSSQHGEQASGSGGGVYLSGGCACCQGCTFTTNYAYGQQSGSSGGWGGGLFVSGTTQLVFDTCTFAANRAYGTAGASILSQGGALYLTGSSLTGTVTGCTIRDSTGETVTAAVYMDSGSVAMTNTLIVRSVADAVRCNGGTLAVVNSTFANNPGRGLNRLAGTASLKNSIVWANTAGQLNSANTVTYSDVQGAMTPGTGNMNADPLFVSTASYDYHPMSTKGSWHNGAWTVDAANSPCIDLGDPADSVGVEPAPNGSRINIGAYGGTAQASLTPDAPGSINSPVVSNPSISGIRRTSARLSGQVTDPGWAGGYCSVWFNYWADGSSTTNVQPMNLQNGTFYTDVAGLTLGTLYHVTILASNSAGTVTTGETTFTTVSGSPVAWYVAPTGSGVDGTNWATAFTTIENALPLCTVAGDTLYVKYGTWSRTAPLTLSSQSTVIIKGGYLGSDASGSPGSLTTTNTVLSAAVNNTRLLYMSGCTATLERVTMQGGYWSISTLGTGYGAGAYLQNCDLTLNQCMLNGNRMQKEPDFGTGYGAGMYATASRLVLNGSTISSNEADRSDGNHTWLYGGGIYAVNSTIIASNGTVFAGNYISADGDGEHGYGEGGALWMSGGTGQIVQCTFSNNYTFGRFNSDSVGDSLGGAIYASGVPSLIVQSNLFIQNYGYAYYGSYVIAPRGGTIFLTGTAGQTVIQGCQIFTNSAAQNYVDGSVWLDAGTLGMTNTLLASNAGSAVTCKGGSAQIVNCTLAYNSGYGVNTNGGTGTATVKNTIAWGNGAGGILAGTVTYSDALGLSAVNGNLSSDPSFVNAAAYDFHEMSKSGSWHNAASDWVVDGTHSVCIDAGDPGDSVGVEPAPNGGIINMGAYGGTMFASKTWAPPAATESPVVAALGAGIVRRENARMWGQVVDSKISGNPNLPVWFYWWAEGGATNVVPMGVTSVGTFYSDLSGLTGGTTYHYKVLGSNSFSTAWSSEIVFATLSAGPVNWYVARDGTGDGTNWATAFQTINAALAQSTVSGDTICMKAGVYTNPVLESLNLSSHVPIVFRGKFVGNGAPGDIGSAPSVITRDPSQNARVLTASGTTGVFENVSILNGATPTFGGTGTPPAFGYGGGLFLQNCDFTFSNCTVAGNNLSKDFDVGYGYGGGFYVSNGALRLVGSLIASNGMTVDIFPRGGNHTWGYGGGVYATNALVTATGCTFLANNMNAHSDSGEESYAYGGALYLNGGSAQIAGCAFSNNWIEANAHVGGAAQGGAIWASGLTSLTVAGTSFQGNYGYGTDTSFPAALKGGLFYLDGTGMTTRITGCQALSNTAAQTYVSGEVWLNAGTLGMTNVLLAANASNGLVCVAGTASAVNCTLAGNTAWGLTNTAATVTLKNDVVWGNAIGGIGGTATVNYSDVQGGVAAGTGNLSIDPLFVNPAALDYHEQSKGGSWHNGLWTHDAGNSPVIDKGDPADSAILEPLPNGNRINMGAFGGTPQASKSVAMGSVVFFF
jgi:hypothetical protein